MLGYKEIKGFKVGDTIWNSTPRENIELRVISEPIETYSDEIKRNQLRWKCQNILTGEEHAYLVTEGLEHYGPSLYTSPAYITLPGLCANMFS